MTRTETELEITRDDSSSHDVILEVRDVDVTFDMERGTSRVLDGVRFDVHRDEMLGIVGESGSGKSMFASALLNAVVDPGQTSGEIIYHPPDGEPVDVLSLSEFQLERFRWEEISMVFQGAMSSFNPTMKIGEHFEETIRAHGEDIEERMEHGWQLLADLYLDPGRVFDSYPHELSGGMKQRTLIALSLILEPKVLVMDEPTAALDLLMQRSIMSLLGNLQEEYDLTIVFITHDLPLVAGLADRLAVMYAFEFVEYGPSEQVIRDATHPYTRALLKSVPSVDASLEDMHPIEGESPDPVNAPSGCSYHPRCPLATVECVQADPDYHEVSEERGAACFHWEQSGDEIEYALGVDPDEFPESTAAFESEEETVVSLDDVDVHFEQAGLIDELFGKESVVRAVNDVSIELRENEVVALVGESGCGKTTLGKTVIGLQEPTDGSVSYRDQDIWEAKAGGGDYEFDDIRRALQIVHQDPGSSLNSSRTVRASLSAPLKRWRPDLGPSDRETVIYNLLKRVGMKPPEDYAARFPHQLSGGEKQRVVLVRALLMSPDLILADEAVSALDVSLRVEMMDLMLDLQELFDTSYLFISHDFSNARYLTEKSDGRIGIMYLGNLVEIGPAQEIISDPKHPYTKVLRWATPPLDPDEAKEANATDPPIREIDIPDPTDPPSGCPFQTRCPDAREVCTREVPELQCTEGAARVACFREDDDHEYWASEPIESDTVSLETESEAD
ncbi:ABC transporter ATP-binding protein [Natrialba taiwanensis]|uniref:Oligopeptide/dipeptide ABC transporter ATPase n=1 Tax=Natrialba taiwanensis DSM 12281 TaxID=1230458 RepID=M0A1Y3_9EURY|nr:ABC transporter ATP-binding protein [Natrialba taiwanensis]ELY91852.1 oligopeptide/dipeptide ABC transporter ATPase [Natrialba taiwanensis DSM 12281]